MLDSFGLPNMAYVGCRVYAAVLRLRAGQLRRPRALGVAPPVEDEVSEEIVVWGESDDGGGGSVDVLSIPAWMFEFHINTNLPPLGPTGGVGTPGGGDDTPETDPCAGLRNALDSCDASLAADQTALDELNRDIAAATTREEKQALRQEKRNTMKSMKETRQLKKDLEQQMQDLGC